jgi:hypothetical protein
MDTNSEQKLPKVLALFISFIAIALLGGFFFYNYRGIPTIDSLPDDVSFPVVAERTPEDMVIEGDIAATTSLPSLNESSASSTAVSAPQPVSPPPPPPPPKPIPTPPPESYSVEWLVPSVSVTLQRGDPLFVGWRATGETSAVRVIFTLLSNQSSNRQTAYFTAGEETGFFTVEVPPGLYTLTQSATAPTRLGGTVKSKKTIFVDVVGPSPVVSPDESEIEFDAYSGDSEGIITADGICNVSIIAYVYDTYVYEMENKMVVLKSNRGDVDSILSFSSSTDEYGEMSFVVTSKTPGVAKLTASVDGIEFRNALILTVTDNPDYAYCDNL